MPYGDWQFYVVTLAALLGVWLMFRTLRTRGGLKRCPSCSENPERRETKATLTIEGQRR